MKQTKEDSQKELGAYYTPYNLAFKIVSETIFEVGSICDPACGDGVFLEAAANVLDIISGKPPESILNYISGVDIDRDAAESARKRMINWYKKKTNESICPKSIIDLIENNIVHADAFNLDKADWPNVTEILEDNKTRYGYKYVIGNPPFLSQLSTKTANPELKKKLNERFGISGTYTDISTYFYFLGLSLLDKGLDHTAINMIQPVSTLSSEGAKDLRERLLEGEVFIGYSEEDYFDAKVKICNIRLRNNNANPERSIEIGFIEDEESCFIDYEKFREIHKYSNSNSFSPLVALLHKYPIDILSKINVSGLLGEHVTTTAGFRDEYYEIVENIEEKKMDWKPNLNIPKGKGGPVISTGMIEPNLSRYGEKEFRIGGKKYKNPIYVGDPSPKLQNYFDSIEDAMFIVATQTKVIEAMQLGYLFIPLTPIISVTLKDAPGFSDFYYHHILAVLLSPVASFYAYTMFGGGGMGGNSMKLSAKNILTIPMPHPWSHKVCNSLSLLHKHDGVSKKFGYEMCKVYELDDDDANTLTEWWWNRLPSKSKRDDT